MRYVIESAALFELVRHLKSDKTDFVEVDLVEGDPPPAANPFRPYVRFAAFRGSEPEQLYGFDVETVPLFEDDLEGPVLVTER